MTAYKEVNIILFGETGVGKSTFINAFANFLSFDNFEEARNGIFHHLIPTTFSISDDNFVMQTVSIGNPEDPNENSTIGESSTQMPKPYTFVVGELKITLIDNPGFCDSRGVLFDKENFELVMNHMSGLKEIHAVCYLMKPDDNILSASFKYSISQLFLRLGKSATNNVIFVFTKSKATSYKPGSTKATLEKFLKDEKISIPCSKKNIYCVDNEPFRYLVALQKGITFSEDDISEQDIIWKKCAEEYWRLMTDILGEGNRPYDPKYSIALNNARKSIGNLWKILADMTVMIMENLSRLEDEKKIIEDKDISIAKWQKMLDTYITVETKKLDGPVLSCLSENCREKYKVNGNYKFRNKLCVDACDVSTSWKFFHKLYLFTLCSWFSGNCKCGCPLRRHDLITYTLDFVEHKIENFKTEISTEEEKKQAQEQKLEKLEAQVEEYKEVEEIIVTSMVKFNYFLKKNAIITHNDSYSDYLDLMIENAKGNNELEKYQDMKMEYDTEKEKLEQLTQSKSPDFKEITPQDIEEAIEKLKNLKHVGQTVTELFHHQENITRRFQTECSVITPTHISNRFKNVLKIGVKLVSGIFSGPRKS